MIGLLRLFIFTYALTFGMNDGAFFQYELDDFEYLALDKPLFIDFNAEIQAGPFFVGGGTRTDFMAESLTIYRQTQDTYTFRGGLRFQLSKGVILEGGYRHSCYHPGLAYATVEMLSGQKIAVPQYEGSADEFYVTIKGRAGG